MSSAQLVITVNGTPAPQGSKRHVGNGRMIEMSRRVRPWREAVKWAALDIMRNAPAVGSPARIDITFFLTRPKTHYRTNGKVRDNAPVYPAGRPDLDKLLRSTLDGLVEAGAIRDDAHIVEITAGKRYCNDDARPGAVIRVFHM